MLESLKQELLELHNNPHLDAVIKANEMGKIIPQLKLEASKQGIAWRHFTKQLGISRATLYNAENIARGWVYLEKVHPLPLKQAIRLIYPREQLPEKVHEVLRSVNVLWSS